MHFTKIALGILFIICVSRFVPHPPNFTSVLALSFYIPLAFGIKFIPVVILSIIFTDIIIGLHSSMIFTLGSIIIIGIISKYFNRSVLIRVSGAITGAVIFFLVTNFGVWLNGSYGYSMMSLKECYILAIPFFGYSLISTLLFSLTIETMYKIFQRNIFNFLR